MASGFPPAMERDNHQVNALAEIAGLGRRKEKVQTLTFVDDLLSSKFGLIEMPNELLDLVYEGKSDFVIRGDLYEEAVLCTENTSYAMRVADTSNALLLLPSLKTPKCTDFEENNICLADVKIVGSLSSYYELKKVKPKLSKLRHVLGKTAYNGPEHDSSNIGDKCTFDDLRGLIQASDAEIREALDKICAFQLDGFWRVLNVYYKEKAFSQILKLAEEEQWELDEIPLERTCEQLKELYPREVLENCLEIYGERSNFEDESEVIYRLSGEKVCQFVAECILRGAEKFNYHEFFEAWQQSVPDGLHTSKEQLRGIALEDVNSHPPVIWHFPAYELPDEPSERFNKLFKVKAKWTSYEIEPYIRELCGPSGSMNALLLKFARCSTDSLGNKIYNSKSSTW